MPLQNADPVASAQTPLFLLIVDDEALARARIRTLLADIAAECPTSVAGEADSGLTAMSLLSGSAAIDPDVVLADIHMPHMDGIELAGHLGKLPSPPAIIFTTAYDTHAVQAFEVNAVDYLLKPVRAPRLRAALQKARQRLPAGDTERLAALGQELRGGGRSHLSCHERGRVLLVPVEDILYFKADLKYVTARTLEREYLLDETLNHLEMEFPDDFIRLHRSTLIARTALAGFERAREDCDAHGWALIAGLPEKLPVSRRQWSVLKELASRNRRS
ncbi:MAG: LytTR family DNA-binding domain-containing protein [Zoogloeaceae bacterium]|jgi:two-component system response regulator AlgR|nr:LytTR family DNA-binding domain-containing protein [Zoogloeaceae bacterium]